MRYAVALVAVAVAGIYLNNASWRAYGPRNDVRLIAHRGVHQTYSRENLGSDTCTAQRIDAPRHDLIENTIPSMKAAFAAGADIVELDVHPTTDGRLAVIHDWTLDCRTEGKGVTREHSLASLKVLDVGHGYTADGGRTFPLRGKGVGLMPALDEVLDAIPDGRFLVNFKSNEEREAHMLAQLATANVWGIYGGAPPTRLAAQLLPGRKSWTRQSLVACLWRYAALGWSGHVPQACRGTMLMVPVNVAPWLWGWPNLFQERMREAGSEIILTGPYVSGDPGATGIDTAEDVARVPVPFDGYLWTNRIEAIGPMMGR